jgi:predicted lipoprotein with Yx(FWY)xxD motif
VRRLTTALAAAALALAGCGDDDADSQPAETPAGAATTQESAPAGTAARRGTKIRLRGSDFGRMLWGPGRQAIYIFERDAEDRSRCYGDCAEAWPPVYAKGRPVAGRGVRRALLGVTRRRDGRRQVTYDGQPLYYYAHEGPGEVLCHDVFLNGGYWWVVGKDGERRP